MMTKVADHASDDNREFILANLHDIMPGLIKVRKEEDVLIYAERGVLSVARF